MNSKIEKKNTELNRKHKEVKSLKFEKNTKNKEIVKRRKEEQELLLKRFDPASKTTRRYRYCLKVDHWRNMRVV